MRDSQYLDYFPDDGDEVWYCSNGRRKGKISLRQVLEEAEWQKCNSRNSEHSQILVLSF